MLANFCGLCFQHECVYATNVISFKGRTENNSLQPAFLSWCEPLGSSSPTPLLINPIEHIRIHQIHTYIIYIIYGMQHKVIESHSVVEKRKSLRNILSLHVIILFKSKELETQILANPKVNTRHVK